MKMRAISFGAGCGAVSALLFAVISTSSPLAFPLYLVAPLPILIATLGFTQQAGLIASLTAFVATSILFTPLAGVIHAVSISLPSWFIGYLALLARPSNDPQNPEAVEWYPTGRLLLWTITLSALLTMVGVLMLGNDYDAFVASFERMLNELIAFEPALFSGLIGSDQSGSIASIAHFLALVAAPLSAALSTVISVVLLYAAGRIVNMSGLLPRPWPDLAATRLPKPALGLLLLSLILTLIGGDFFALFGRIGLASLIIGYCLQGLAVIHFLTRPIKSRRMMLVLIYSVFLFLPGWPILGFAAIGIADFFLDFRTRFTASSLPPL
jgi:Predicted membrane protein (DUF2232)